MMTMYQSLLMALVSLPFCVLKNWGLKKCHCSLSTPVNNLTVGHIVNLTSNDIHR